MPGGRRHSNGPAESRGAGRGQTRHNGRGKGGIGRGNGRGHTDYYHRGRGATGRFDRSDRRGSGTVGSMSMDALLQSLPTGTSLEGDPSVHLRRQSVSLLMNASISAAQIPALGDTSPHGYCQTIVREVLQEHRAFLHSVRIDRESWATWDPDSMARKQSIPLPGGQSAAGKISSSAKVEDLHKSLIIIKRPAESPLLAISFISQDGEFYLGRTDADAERSFNSCANQGAAYHLSSAPLLKESTCYHLLGYVGDALAALEACLHLLHVQPSSALLCAAADPTRRREVGWSASFSDETKRTLNSGQLHALTALKYNVEVIQGPPGTGKSTTIYHLVRDVLPVQTKAVVCAVQNRAIEAICQKLETTASQMGFFVEGNPERLSESSTRWTLKKQAHRDPRVVQQRRLRAAAKFRLGMVQTGLELYIQQVFPAMQLRRSRRELILRQLIAAKAHLRPYAAHVPPDGLDKDKQDAFEQYFECNDGWKKLAISVAHARVGRGAASELLEFFKEVVRSTFLQEQLLLKLAKTELAQKARVVLCTAAMVGPLTASGDSDVQEYMLSATAAIVDEAGTCPDRSIVPLLPLNFDRLVLIGDEKQLPPFSRLNENERPPSLLCRAVEAVGGHMLTKQYRMPKKLCDVVSKAFYDDKLITEPRGNSSSEAPVVFISSDRGKAEMEERGKSLFNQIEAETAVKLALDFSIRAAPSASIALLSFYKSQVRLMEKMVEESGLTGRVLALSVDSAQGQEFDFVVLSAVVDGSRRSFVEDRRRQCVALSRAKQSMVLVATHAICDKIDAFGDARFTAGS